LMPRGLILVTAPQSIRRSGEPTEMPLVWYRFDDLMFA